MFMVLRVLHIVLGVLWVGMFFFMTFFLLPAMQEAGPGGAAVGAALQRRRLLSVMPLLAIVTLLSGGWLYWIVSDGFTLAYVHSTMGRTLAMGGVFAVMAFVIGITIYRPAMMRAAAIAASLASGSESERASRNAELSGLRARSKLSGHVIGGLLLLSVVAMAVGRYL